MFKSAAQPLCRACAKPIRKFTVTHMLNVRKAGVTFGKFETDWSKSHLLDAPIYTKEEAQRLSNGRIVSLARRGFGDHPTAIHKFSTWDGESYADEFFCSGSCAAAFGRMAARHSAIETNAYAVAIRGRA